MKYSIAPGGNYQFTVNVQCLDGTISENADWFAFSTLASQDTGQIASNASQSVHMVYPNPVRETMKVRIPDELSDYPAIIELSDMMGRVILSREEPNVNGGDEVQISVHTLRDGVYQLSVKSQSLYFHELVMITR